MPRRKKSSKSQTKPQSSEPFHEKVRSKLNENLILALPIGLVNAAVLWVINHFFSQPWQILWLALPLTFVAWLAWRRVVGHPSARLGKSFLLLFALYVLIFSLAAGAGFLNWKRTLQGYDRDVPSNFLALNWAGDWRYHFVSKMEPDTDFAVILTTPGETVEAGRVHIAQLIKFAGDNGAKGLAFDFLFKDDSIPVVDQRLCKEFRDSKIPIFVGHAFERIGEEITWKGMSPSLKDCLPEDRQGHTVAYAELDNKIRLVPMYFKNDRKRESLSLKIARELQNGVPPADGLLQFIKPETDFPQIVFEDLNNQKARLKDKFLLVGERGAADIWQTPYGPLPGVLIHSYAVHSLRKNHYLRRVPLWSSFVMVYAGCFMVTFFNAQGWSRRRIVLMTLLGSLVIWLISLIAVSFWSVWLDVIYPLLAMWLLVVLFLVLKKVLGVSEATPA